MAVDTTIIGRATGAYVTTVERGPVSTFARSVRDQNPLYQDLSAATAAGFSNIPVAPTYTMALPVWGNFREEQPPDPTGGNSPMHAVMAPLAAQGALVLHGEQEFVYHRPILVGDRLTATPTVTDIYEKDSERATMTFVVIETVWRDADSGEPVLTEKFNLISRLSK